MKITRYSELGKGNMGWLKTSYHFSFANYYNPNRVHLGPLRVINDDYIKPHSGFDTHPHNDMEIITYVISGTLTHKDSMGNERKLSRHGVQYMSAGTGIYHSEHNLDDEELHLFQTWIFPSDKGLIPNYGDKEFDNDDFDNKFTNIVSGEDDNGIIHINQHASIKVGMFDKGTLINIPLSKYSTTYLILIDGELRIEDNIINNGDSIEVDKDINLEVIKDAHIYMVQV